MFTKIDCVPGADVALFLPSLGGGGAERSTVDLANSLARAGYKIDLVLVSAEGPFLDRVSGNVSIVDIKAGSVAKALPGFIAYLRRVKPRSILSAMTHANVVAILARALGHRRAVLAISERGSPREATVSGRSSSRQKVVMLLARYLYRRADLVVTVANSLNSDVANLFRVPQDKIFTIYNGIFKSNIQAMAAAEAPHPWLDQNEIPVILAVGRLSREKGMDLLVEAFGRVRAERQCRLLIYGEGDERIALGTQARETGYADDIAFPGFIANPFAAMARAAVFVLPSRSEGLPGALIEAMACGTAVIATDSLGGAAEVLEGGKWGLLVKSEDSGALAEAILRTLDTPLAVDVRLRAADFSEGRTASQYINALALRKVVTI